jgi:tRNA (mo5U34)-methyltransferase
VTDASPTAENLRRTAQRVVRVSRRLPDMARAVRAAAHGWQPGPKELGGVQHPPVGTRPTPPFTLREGIDREQFAKDVATRDWFHTFDFGGGIVASGPDPSHQKTQFLGLPDSFEGLRVLDIGAYDGHYSFEAARRGAAEVVAADHFVWTWPGNTAKDNFEFVRDALGMNDVVKDVTVKVEDMTPEIVGSDFDVVFFYGVLYHAPDPLGYLKRVRAVTAPQGQVLIETVVDLLDVPRPALAYYPGAYLNNDGSNHFGPNILAVRGLLEDAGFSRMDDLGLWRYHELEVTKGAPLPPGPPKSGRAVMRARP